MNDKNTKYLLEKYPKLYAQYYWDKKDTCMNWGFDCGDGWLKLIDGLSRRITKLDPEGEIQAVQVKNKFAMLRFYFRAAGENKESLQLKHTAVGALVAQAEKKSTHLCEECGKKGKIRDDSGWYITLCEKHHKERMDPNKLVKKLKSLSRFRHEKNKKYK
jgi:hypothetical protein